MSGLLLRLALLFVARTAHAAPAAEGESALLPGTVSFCASPAPTPSESEESVEDCMSGTRCQSRGFQLTCLAMNDALLQEDQAAAEANCCNDILPLNENIIAPYIQWPRAHVEAALYFVERHGNDKPVDYTFAGGLDGGSDVNGSRAWVRPFAEKYFTPNSVFVDTSADLETVSARGERSNPC